MLAFILEGLVSRHGDRALLEPPAEVAAELCGHSDPEVRAWAMQRLAILAHIDFGHPRMSSTLQALQRGVEAFRVREGDQRLNSDEEFCAQNLYDRWVPFHGGPTGIEPEVIELVVLNWTPEEEQFADILAQLNTLNWSAPCTTP